MITRLASGLMLVSFLAGAAHAECVYPKSPTNLPDGATATQDEMVAGMKAVKEYNENVNTYLTCLETEQNTRIEAAGDDAQAVEQIKAIHTKRHNAAVEELEASAAQFNEQVKVFKERSKKS
jgi:hypothetical protein